MSKTNEHQTPMKEESSDRFSSDLDELKSSFSKLREDVTRLLENASGTARSGAEALKDRARSVKHRGVESVERIEERLSQKPLLSLALAGGIGFLVARILLPHR